MPDSAAPDPAPEAKSWEQFYEMGRRRFAEGDAAGAEQAFRDAITAAETPGGDPLQLASSLSSLGQLKYQQKDYTQAEDCFKRSLKLREGVLGRDHPVVISGINNLAASYVARGALDDAEPLLQRAMTVTVKRVEATQSELSVNLNNLVRLYVKRGDYARAEPLLTQLLSLKRPLGPEHPDVAAVLVTLAKLRFSMGRPADAERLWRRVLTVREKVLPPGDLIIAGTIEGLADTCAAQDKRAEELEFRERALAVREATLGPAHPTLDPMRLRITELRRALGNQPARISVPVSVAETTKLRVSPVTGAVAGLRRTSPIATLQSPSGIPDFDMGTSPTPAVHAATMRTSGGKAIDQRAPIFAVAPSLPTPPAVKWIEPSHLPPASQTAPRPPHTDRRSSRRLNLTKHREPDTSGRTKLLWFSVVLLAGAGAGAFVYGRDLWSSVRSPLPAALKAVGHQATPAGSHAIAPTATTATTATGAPAPPAAATATPAPTAAATPSSSGVTAATTQPTTPSASPSATDPSAPAPGAAAGAATAVTATTAQPAAPSGATQAKAPAAPPTRPAAAARSVTVAPLVAAPRHPAVITSSIPHFSPAAPIPPVHERKPTATSAAPVAPTVDIPNVSVPSVDVDAATRTIDDAAKPQTTPSSPP